MWPACSFVQTRSAGTIIGRVFIPVVCCFVAWRFVTQVGWLRGDLERW